MIKRAFSAVRGTASAFRRTLAAFWRTLAAFWRTLAPAVVLVGILVMGLPAPAAAAGAEGAFAVSGAAAGPGSAAPAASAAGAPEFDWVRQFGSAGPDYFRQMAVDGEAVYVAAAGTYSGNGDPSFLRKYDLQGNELWTRDNATCVAAGPDGIYAGESAWDTYDSSWRKLDSAGNQIWTRRLSDEGHISNPTEIVVDAGGIYMAQSVWGNPDTTCGDFCGSYVCRYDADGNLSWSREPWTWSGHMWNTISGIAPDSSGIYVLWDATDDGFLWRYDTDGEQVWVRCLDISDPGFFATKGIAAGAGGVYVVGESGHPDSMGYFLRKYDAGGNLVWARQIALGESHGQSLVVATRGDFVYVAGSTLGAPFGQASQGGYDAFVCKYDSDGNRVWARQFGTGADDQATAVSVSDGFVYLGGSTGGALAGGESQGGGDAFLLRLRDNGAPARPGNTAPVNGAVGISPTATLRSSAFSDPDAGDTHAASQWQITGQADNYTSPVFDSGADPANLTQISVPSGMLDYLATYYWHVRHQDSRGAWSEWSEETSFRTSQAGVGWELQEPPAQWSFFRGVYGTSPTNVLVVGDGGAILHFEGSGWKAMASGTAIDLADVWGGSDGFFAVGAAGTILQYDGDDWTSVESGTGADLAGIWGSSQADVFAVGDRGTILHSDGTGWSPMEGGTTVALHDVWGNSSSDVFAVGDGGIILHYDGSLWSAVDSGTAAGLNAVRGDSSYVYAVGDLGSMRRCPVGGTTWDGIESGTSCTLSGIWSDSPSNVVTITSSGEIRRFDGSAWSEGTGICDDYRADLGGIWACSPSDIFVAGDATVCHYDGRYWRYSMNDDMSRDLVGVWGSSGGNVYAIGLHGARLRYDGCRWDRTWSGQQPSADIGFVVRDIWGSSSSDVFVLVMNVPPGLYDNSVWHYDGDSWSGAGLGCSGQPHAIWGSSSSDVFVVGEDYGEDRGAGIVHFDGDTWSFKAAGTTFPLLDVWGSSPSDVFAVGDNGTILHFDGVSWGPMAAGTCACLWAVWGTSSSDVFAAGDDGVILHYDGNEWTPMESGTAVRLNGIWGSSPSDVFAVGNGGTILYYDGNGWSAMATGTTANLNAIWGSAGSYAYAVGDGATVLRCAVPASLTVATGPADNVTASTARLNGDLVSLGAGSSVQVCFEWGLTAAYGNVTAPEAITETGTFSAEIAGLSPGTTYHFRAKAAGDGTSCGEDITLTTATMPEPPAPPDDAGTATGTIGSGPLWSTRVVTPGIGAPDPGQGPDAGQVDLGSTASARVALWVYPVAIVGSILALGFLASIGAWLRGRLVR